MTLSNAQPFLLSGGSTGCLLIHGFSGTPDEMRDLGETLARQGYTVLGVQLAGHTGHPEALRTTRWQDWLASAQVGLNDLRTRCTSIIVIGLSLGGALSILLARQSAVERLVLLATPLWLQGDWRIHLLPVARHFIPWYYPLEQASFSDPGVRQRILAHAPDLDLEDPIVQRRLRRSIKLPISAIDELTRVLRRARATLPYVRVPTLVMHGRHDEVAPLASAEEIITRIGTNQKRLVWWAQTGHQLLAAGPERDAIYTQIASFVAGNLC